MLYRYTCTNNVLEFLDSDDDNVIAVHSCPLKHLYLYELFVEISCFRQIKPLT